MSTDLVHATAVAIDGHGVLLLGPSGSGKSDLALRLIDRGALLISDDAVPVHIEDGLPILRTARHIAGELEVRGVGIVSVDHRQSATLRLVVQITDLVERMPEDNLAGLIAGFSVPLVNIVPVEASAPIKIEYALRMTIDAGRWPVAIDGTDATGSRIS